MLLHDHEQLDCSSRSVVSLQFPVMPSLLVEQAKRTTGIGSDSKLLEAAEWLLAQRGTSMGLSGASGRRSWTKSGDDILTALAKYCARTN